MALTMEDLHNRLRRFDEITLLEILEIDSEMLVQRFQDLIEDRFDDLESEFEDDEAEYD